MTDRVVQWLQRLGLDRCGETFEANDIDFRSLPHLIEADLKETGVSLARSGQAAPQ